MYNTYARTHRMREHRCQDSKRFDVDGYKSKVFRGDVTVITWYFNEKFNIHCAFIVIIVYLPMLFFINKLQKKNTPLPEGVPGVE